jgi:L-lysine 2,3-aminomutase
MLQDQSAGQHHNIEIVNKVFERVEQFKYLGTTVANQSPFMRKLRAD